KEVDDLQIRSGTSIREKGGNLHPVDFYHMHPRYNPDSNEFDIAVIKVKIPFAYGNQIQPIALASENPKIGAYGILTGYGFINQDGLIQAAQLQQLHVPIVSSELCKQVYKGDLTENMLCAGISGGEGACFADSGGPLVVNGVLVGVVSFMVDRCDKPVPQVFADVPAMLDFVISVIKQKQK
ncbi:hypothetical protein L9F63_011257, partial [Diploptera punctata]